MCMAYCYGSYIATGCGKANVTKGCSGDLRHRRTPERVEEDRESGLWESETNMISHETFFPPMLSMNTPWMSECGLPVSSLCVTLSLWKAHRINVYKSGTWGCHLCPGPAALSHWLTSMVSDWPLSPHRQWLRTVQGDSIACSIFQH